MTAARSAGFGGARLSGTLPTPGKVQVVTFYAHFSCTSRTTQLTAARPVRVVDEHFCHRMYHVRMSVSIDIIDASESRDNSSSKVMVLVGRVFGNEMSGELRPECYIIERGRGCADR